MVRKVSVLFASFALLASCTALSPDGPGKDSSLERMVFEVRTDEPQTRTELGLYNHINWQSSDELTVFSNTPETGNYCFTLKSGEGSNQAVFEGDALPTATFCTLYPYTSGAVFNYGSQKSTVRLHWDGSSQNATPNSFDPTKALMAGCSDGDGIHFKNLCAFFKITTDFDCKKIEIYSPDYNFASDDVTINYFQKEDTVTMEKATTSQQSVVSGVAIVAPSNGTIAPGTYYIAALPQEHYGFIVRVTTTQGVVLTRRATDSKYWGQLKPGVALNLGKFTAGSFDGGDGFIGSGTQADPYQIGNRRQFDLLREKLNNSSTRAQFKGKHYLQTADIDFHGDTTNLMCGYYYEDESFTGTYDGGGHKLSNIVYPNVKGHYQHGNCSISALFCNVWNATIRNLTVECKGMVDNIDESVAMYGGFVGVCEASDGGSTLIENCTFKPAQGYEGIDCGQQTVNYGGFVGQNQGNLKIFNCTNEVPAVSSYLFWSRGSEWEYSFGGFIGKTVKGGGDDYWVNIIYCRNNAEIRVTNAPDDCHVGGIVGYALEEWLNGMDVALKIFNTINRGNIAGCCSSRDDDSYTGGIIGKNDADGGDCGDPILVNCMNSGSIGGAGNHAYCGGIMGWCYDNDTRICACANVGSVYTDDGSADYPRPGALCGNPQGEYYNCAFTSGKITYDREITDEHVHNAYPIDAYPPLQLSGDKMNELYNAVPQSLRDEITSKTGKTASTWTGLWNHQNQQGLDMNF